MSYSKMSKKELTNVCKENKIIGISNKNKSQLLELIAKNKINIKLEAKTKTSIAKEESKTESKTEYNLEIIDSKEQTKKWRQDRNWYKNGKSNECEIYQKKIIKNLIGYEPNKTNDRFYIETNEIISKTNSMKDKNGFEYTEDFDGYVLKNDKINNIKIYFNLKFCCDAGGAQTRTLPEVYHFISCQIKYITRLINQPDKDIPTYFINILDGDTSYKNMDKYRYLLDKEQNKDIKNIILKYIFIGNMLEFSKNTTIIEMLKIKQ